MTRYDHPAPRWKRPDMHAADNPWQKHWDRCKTDPCPLGCQEIPSSAVYARAAELAAEWAEDYHESYDAHNTERAERSAAWLRERADCGNEVQAEGHATGARAS